MKLSVAMCTYNGARFLREQLASVAAQTRTPDELIVCDDCSQDETPQIVEAFAAEAPFDVRLQRNAANLGSTKNFEQAIRLCDGHLIALSDQDDVWLPEKLETLEAELARRPTAGLVFSDADVVDENLRPLGFRLWQATGEANFGEAKQKLFREGMAFDVLLAGNVVTGATMAFRAEYRELLLPIPGDTSLIHDGWIAMLLAAVSELAFISRPLIKYRQHAAQQLGAYHGPASAGGLKAMRRANPYASELHRLMTLAERLRAKRAAFDGAAALAKLNEKAAHLRARMEISRAGLGRVPRIARELLTRRYHLYSNGVYSAAKDLFS
ncbi:MAG TPA: glycosyltransferase family 2 protein [Pyrinomonadaceae bacterium]|nr:glycosyltransferase family 2 protein [Pyrinomonadaceae bacterium]